MRHLLIVAIVLLTGCAQGKWYKAGTTEAQFRQDAYQCEIEAANTYPANVVQQNIGTGYQAPSRTSCQAYGSQIDCTTRQGTYTPPPTIAIDYNQGNRNQARNQCLYARGYSFIQAGQEPNPYTGASTSKYNLQCFVKCREDGGTKGFCESACPE